MIFAYAAAVAAAATHNPAWFLGGAYHPPLPGKSDDGLLHALGSGRVDAGAAINGEALTVALDVVQAWAVLLTLGFTLIIFFFLAFCVCSKKDDGYDEFEISQGITTVRICHDGGENGVSLIPRINGSGTESLKATDETSEASSRYTLKRELPAIPTNTQVIEANADSKRDRPVSQHSSELYASVSEPPQGSSSFKLIGGVQVLPAGAIAPGGRAAVVKESVSSPEGDQPDSGKEKKDLSKSGDVHHAYMQVKKSHQYAQVQKKEHPYAKVTRRDEKGLEKDTDNYDEPKFFSKDPRKRESEGRYQSAPHSVEKHKEDVTAVASAGFMPKSGHSYGDLSSKSGTASGGATSPLLTTSIHSTFSAHSTSGRSPTSPQSRTPTSPSQPDTLSSIPAAMAISGRTPANEEMPYMTPPVLQSARDQQQHFSGDSQDSRGYTSISVREPLAALKARQAAESAITGVGRGLSSRNGLPSAQGHKEEGYYMTVSDDSADEMYACIYEGSRGTGSETYAQIEPRTTPSSSSSQPPPLVPSPSNAPASPTIPSAKVQQDQSPPAPPSVDSLRHVVHSRQASASSATSTGMGSPVAEKRGTRSPLPPLPQGDISLYSPPDPPILSSQTAPKSPPKATAHIIDRPTPRSLEEMYAKVLKKHPGHSRGSSSGAVEGDTSGSLSSSRRGSADVGGSRWTTTSPVTPKPSQDMSHSLVETRNHDVASNINRAKSCEVSSAWGGLITDVRNMQNNQTFDNYETIPSQGGSLYSGSDPGYETVKNGEPPYACVERSGNYPGYETVRGSDMESEPGYETLKHKETEPGYETVSEIASKKKPLSSGSGYENVSRGGSISTDYEPGYETVSSKETSDPGYESVQDKEKLDYDPGYEELSHPSHLRTSSETDPNYEQLKFTSRRSSGDGGDNGYEVVKKASVEGNYDLVSDYDTQEKDNTDVFVENKAPASVMPLYASVKKKESPKKETVRQGEKKNNNFNLIETSPIEAFAIPPIEAFATPPIEAFATPIEAFSTPIEVFSTPPIQAFAIPPIEAFATPTIEAFATPPIKAFDMAPIQAFEISPIQAFEIGPIQTIEASSIQSIEETPVQTMLKEPIQTSETSPISAAASLPIQAYETSPIQTVENSSTQIIETSHVEAPPEGQPTVTASEPLIDTSKMFDSLDDYKKILGDVDEYVIQSLGKPDELPKASLIGDPLDFGKVLDDIIGISKLPPIKKVDFLDMEKETTDMVSAQTLVTTEAVIETTATSQDAGGAIVDNRDIREPEIVNQKFQVLDSPEEVELPPPGGEGDSHVVSPPLLAQKLQRISDNQNESLSSVEIGDNKPGKGFSLENYGDTANPQPMVCLTFTEASPAASSPEMVNSPRTSESSSSSSKNDQSPKEPPKKEEYTPALTNGTSDIPAPTQFGELTEEPDASLSSVQQETASILSNNVDDPLPPPPLHSLDDDVATASPPPPPPPILDEVCSIQDLPLPPLNEEPLPSCTGETEWQEGVNGLSPISTTYPAPVNDFDSNISIVQVSCSQGPTDLEPTSTCDLPPPPLPSCEEDKSFNEDIQPPLSPSFKASVNGSITVTVNPMADMEDSSSSEIQSTVQPIVANGTTSQVAPHASAFGTSSGESQSSGSTVNGSGSVESVVTVDAKTGSDPSTTVPTAQVPLQHSSSTSSSSSASDSKHTDPNEGITPV